MYGHWLRCCIAAHTIRGGLGTITHWALSAENYRISGYGAAWSLIDSTGKWHPYFSGNIGRKNLYEAQLSTVNLNSMTVKLIRMGVTTQATDNNDGLYCVEAAIPFPTCGDINGVSASPNPNPVSDSSCGSGKYFDPENIGITCMASPCEASPGGLDHENCCSNSPPVATGSPTNAPTTKSPTRADIPVEPVSCRSETECFGESIELGAFVDPGACAAEVVHNPACSNLFMWMDTWSTTSLYAADYGCRCCSASSGSSLVIKDSTTAWSVYGANVEDCPADCCEYVAVTGAEEVQGLYMGTHTKIGNVLNHPIYQMPSDIGDLYLFHSSDHWYFGPLTNFGSTSYVAKSGQAVCPHHLDATTWTTDSDGSVAHCGCDKYMNQASASSSAVCWKYEGGNKVCRPPNNGDNRCPGDHTRCNSGMTTAYQISISCSGAPLATDTPTTDTPTTNAPTTQAPSFAPVDVDATECAKASKCVDNIGLGAFANPEACAAAVATNSACSPLFIWFKLYSSMSSHETNYGCRCCISNSEIVGTGLGNAWSVYGINPEECPTTSPTTSTPTTNSPTTDTPTTNAPTSVAPTTMVPTTTMVCDGEQIIVGAESQTCADACSSIGLACSVVALDHLNSMVETEEGISAMFLSRGYTCEDFTHKFK